MDAELDVKRIMELLPHRYPFLLVDKVLHVDLEKGEVRALKNVTMNESFFQGHFPGAPVMPGVLIIEAMAQAGGILYYKKESADKIAVLMKVNNAKFRHPVKPGDQLIFHCEGVHWSASAGKIKASAFVGDRLACEAEISFALVDKNKI